VAAFAEAAQASGSSLQSWLQGRDVIEFERYPPYDPADLRSGSQFYCHAHRAARWSSPCWSSATNAWRAGRM
jgi:hypothetical protein